MTRALRYAFVVLMLSSSTFANAAAPAKDEVKWLVTPKRQNSRFAADRVTAAGARVLATYPHMHAIALPAAARDRVGEHLTHFEIMELEEVIRTPRRTIDPRSEHAPAAPFPAGLFLIQFVAPPTAAWQDHLRLAGIRAVESLPERTIIVSATATQIDALTTLPWVQYAGPYLRDYKFTPRNAETAREFLVQIADTPASKTAIARIRERVGGFRDESAYDAQLTARIETDLTVVNELLDEPFVLGIETLVPMGDSDERQALSVTGATAPSGQYLTWLSSRNITPNQLTDSGIVVDIADTGLDMGCDAISEHADLVGRKVYYKGTGAQNQDTGRHGTIIAGIVGGNPVAGKTTQNQATQGYGLKDSDSYGQFYYGLGVAPGIRLGLTRVNPAAVGYTAVAQWTTSAVSSMCNTPTALCTDTSTPCPAVVQNHSHNEYDATGSYAGVYTLRSREFDISVRNATRTTTGTPTPLAITMSAGNYNQNSGDLTTMVMASATAKNVISVGAAETARDSIPAACLDSTLIGNSNPSLRNATGGYNVLAYASRRGTNDYSISRIKPDLVAPATVSYGPRPYLLVGSNYCATGGDPTYPEYHGSSGTSYAAPVAAGAVALLRYKHGAMSPAMYKAMLVGGARSMTGALDRLTSGTVTKWPNEQQGFGMINLADLLGTTPAKAWHDQGTVLTQGQMYERTVTVVNPLQPVRVVLVWTEPPGAAETTIAQVNNLDLTATWPDFYRLYGNYTDTAGWSRPSPGCGRPVCASPSDIRNNVEVLNINPSRFTGNTNLSFTIRVMASPLNGIAVAGQSGGANNQDFALFVLNGTLQ